MTTYTTHIHGKPTFYWNKSSSADEALKEPIRAQLAISVSFPLLPNLLTIDTKKYAFCSDIKMGLPLCHVTLGAMQCFDCTTQVHKNQVLLPLPPIMILRLCCSTTDSAMVILIFNQWTALWMDRFLMIHPPTAQDTQFQNLFKARR